MRIIAGQYRGRQIAAPPGEATRPILDRTKTVLFDMLGARLASPGRLPDVAVLDLFAGSGALGLEALSRGADFCLFIERHRATAGLIRNNLHTLGIVEAARVVEGDAATALWPKPPGRDAYGLVFLDPPYRLLEGLKPDPSVRGILTRLAKEAVIAPDATIIVRHGQQGPGPDLSPLVEVERKDVGTMTFRFMTPPSPRPGAEDAG
jgi:16S rRNA (guanine966-N2)-methyltransferase